MNKSVATLTPAIDELKLLERRELLDRFEKLYGKSPPLRLSTATLALAVAYRLQADALGGLKAQVRRILLADAGVTGRPPAPGTLLIREWHGLRHSVIVHPSHVEYAGTQYRSLTEVAFRITGQKRSGPAFFGLRSGANG